MFGPCKDNNSRPKKNGFVGFMSEVMMLFMIHMSSFFNCSRSKWMFALLSVIVF